jgi:hypothetical protein
MYDLFPFFYDCYVHDYLINEFTNQCRAKIDLVICEPMMLARQHT